MAGGNGSHIVETREKAEIETVITVQLVCKDCDTVMIFLRMDTDPQTLQRTNIHQCKKCGGVSHEEQMYSYIKGRTSRMVEVSALEPAGPEADLSLDP